MIGLELTTARALKDTTATALASLLPTGDKQDDKYIQKAIERINQSLNSDWWVDASTLDPKTGNHVFDREHQAVQELEKVSTVDVQTAIDALLEADRQLVLKELTSAMLSGGDASRILKAHINIADATAHIAAGDFAEAVLDYKKAGTNAVKAQ